MFYGLLAALWVVTSILSYGICLDNHKKDFSYFHYDYKWWLMDLGGPIGLLTTLITHSGKYGFQLRPYTRDERYENFCAMYGKQYKTREQFDKEY